jgi:hypothetical protein
MPTVNGPLRAEAEQLHCTGASFLPHIRQWRHGLHGQQFLLTVPQLLAGKARSNSRTTLHAAKTAHTATT